jgi:sterol desaturase/sphingolipid hydroxylase (fatty acid hydroxylase superfamily)
LRHYNLNHSGYELTAVKLPFVGLSIGTFMPSLPFISQDAAHHDLHHEKFFNNYALSFTWLDKLGGRASPDLRSSTFIISAQPD